MIVDSYPGDYDDEFLYFSLRLNPYLGFFKRISVAIRYIFKREKNLYSYDCVMLPKEEIKDLKQIIDEHLLSIK